MVAAKALIIALVCGLPSATAHAQGESRRLALFIGNDDGGDDTRPLRYATEDARRLHAVLTQLGGVAPQDALLLLNQDAPRVTAALNDLGTRAADSSRRHERTTLIVYYSGHARDGFLRLGATRLDLRAFSQRLRQLGTDVTLGIFDSCQSGIITRSKGARKVPAFAVESDDTTRGLVLLTSSSADEDSQESDAIGGSYFSHHLISGLRGGADRSGDRRVTLAEAYAYAHARTVADTAETTAGAQHPTFSFDLKGNADLVLTNLGVARESLSFPATAPAGIYFVIDATRGLVMAEIEKPANVQRYLALSPGTYRIKRRLADRLRMGDISIAKSGTVIVDETQFHDAPFADDPVKGALHLRTELAPDLTTRTRFSVGAATQSFLDPATRAELFPATGLLTLDLEWSDYFRRRWVWGVDLGLGGTNGVLHSETLGAELPFAMTELALGTTLYREWPSSTGRFTPFFGGRGALLVFARKFRQQTQHIPDQSFATFSPGLVAGIRMHLSGRLALVARGRLHYVFYNLGEKSRSLPFVDLGLVAAWEF